MEATENVLLHILKRRDPETLGNLNDDRHQAANRISELRCFPGAGASDTRSRKALLAGWWEQHPLDTGENVRKWADALWGTETSPDENRTPMADARPLNSGSGGRQTPHSTESLSPQRQDAAEVLWHAPPRLIDGSDSTSGLSSIGVQDERTQDVSNTAQPKLNQTKFELSSDFCRTHVW